MPATAAPPRRFVLDDVPRIHFYEGGPRCPEDVCFPSALRACLEYLGDGLGCKHLAPTCGPGLTTCAYAYLMGVSGAAFFLSWKPGWHGDNVAIHYMNADPAAPFDHAFRAVGRPAEYVQKQPGRDNRAAYLDAIVTSLVEHRRPVLAFGVVGPPEPSIITGYDEDGDVLLGWSFFQAFPEFAAGVETEPCGYFRKRDWFADTHSLAVLGGNVTPPPTDETDREALRWAGVVARTPRVYPDDDRANGFAAYEAWVAQIIGDDDPPLDDLPAWRLRQGVHDDAVGTVAECRWYGAVFLRGMAEREPAMAPDLLAAAGCFEGEHDLMWQVWALGGGNGRSDDHVRAFAVRSAREQMVPLIRQARELDEQAAEDLARALERG